MLRAGAILVLISLAGCGSSDSESEKQSSSSGGAGGTGGVSSGGSAGSSAGASGGGGGASGGSGGVAGSGGAVAKSSKRGIAYGYHSNEDLAALSAGIGWWYNWSPQPDDSFSGSYSALGVEFVPMIWGGQFDTSQLEDQIPLDAEYLLTFNEPNFGAQSNLTPEEAAGHWPEIEAFAQARGMKIVSPAVNYCGSPCNETDPFVWLEKFFAACTGCQVDYVAMHWYACDKPAIEVTLQKYEEKFGKPLWVTEFSCLDEPQHVNDADELAYQAEAVATLEADPMVFRYAWFTGRWEQAPPISLLGDPGQLTPLGDQYVTLPY
jgi:hypothetical protein